MKRALLVLALALGCGDSGDTIIVQAPPEELSLAGVWLPRVIQEGTIDECSAGQPDDRLGQIPPRIRYHH